MTRASNPGNIRINPLQWWRFRPMGLICGGGFALLMFFLWGALTLAGQKASIPTKDGGETPVWLFGFASLITLALYTWLEARKFRTGDANPGVVVSLNPQLVAVATDLTQGVGEFPAVKIIATKLKTSMGQPLQIGTCIPTVATYAHPPNRHSGHWGGFHPLPAEYATGNQEVLRRLLGSFKDKKYVALKHSLAAIQQPYRPGLYAMWEAPDRPRGRRIGKTLDF